MAAGMDSPAIWTSPASASPYRPLDLDGAVRWVTRAIGRTIRVMNQPFNRRRPPPAFAGVDSRNQGSAWSGYRWARERHRAVRR
jgi:hypothetical protein